MFKALNCQLPEQILIYLGKKFLISFLAKLWNLWNVEQSLETLWHHV